MPLPGLLETASNIAAMKPKDLERWTKREDIAAAVVFVATLPEHVAIPELLITPANATYI